MNTSPNIMAPDITTSDTTASNSSTSAGLSDADIIAIRENRKTPCVGSCNTFYAETCYACGRSIAEKARWPGLTEDEKSVIWERVIRHGWRPRVGMPG